MIQTNSDKRWKESCFTLLFSFSYLSVHDPWKVKSKLLNRSYSLMIILTCFKTASPCTCVWNWITISGRRWLWNIYTHCSLFFTDRIIPTTKISSDFPNIPVNTFVTWWTWWPGKCLFVCVTWPNDFMYSLICLLVEPKEKFNLTLFSSIIAFVLCWNIFWCNNYGL